jgi:hypothetical protein
MLGHGFMHMVRRVVFVGFMIWCAGVVLMAVVALALYLLNPFAGFDGKSEFVGLSGPAAKCRLEEAWPGSVDPGAVKTVNYKCQWSRDSYSTWYRIQLTRDMWPSLG